MTDIENAKDTTLKTLKVGKAKLALVSPPTFLVMVRE